MGRALLLKSKTPAPVVTTNVQPENHNRNVLPNRPEEVWHYIKELETRTVPVDNNPSSVEKNMRFDGRAASSAYSNGKEQKRQKKRKN